MDKANTTTEKPFLPEVKHLQATGGVTVRICTVTACMLVLKNISRTMSEQQRKNRSYKKELKTY